MKAGRRGIIGGLAGLLGACSPAALLNTTVSMRGFSRTSSIAYGGASRQTLDLYLPDTPRADGKAVLFIYGGSWDSGSKDDYLFVAQALAVRGLVVVVPDYRLYPEVRFPVFVEDAALAVRWASDRYGTDKLYVMGHSAGAHSAFMLAADTPWLGRAGVDRTRLRGAIGLAGPYDFLPLTSPRLQAIFNGPDDPATAPINFVRAPLPPALLLHGQADNTVWPRNSQHLATAWKAAGAESRLRLYPGVDHVDIVAAFSALLRGRAPTLADCMAFIDAT